MLTRDQLLLMFRKSNALQRGHFELSSGLHSGHYFQCAQIMQYPRQAEAIGRELRILAGADVRKPLTVTVEGKGIGF